MHGPRAGIHDVVGGELAVRGLVRLADGADADPDEALPHLRFVVTQSAEFLHRAGDRVMELRVVARKPLPEVAVAVPLQAGDDAGPVEARALVVARLGIGQVQLGVDARIRDRSNTGTSAPPPADACRARRACPAIRSSTTRPPRPAACGCRATAARHGNPCSTTSRSPRSDRSRSRRAIPTSSTSDRARPTSAATSRPATASTSRSTAASPGRTCGTRRARSGRWSCTRRTRTSPTPRCSATRSDPTPSAASTARATAARPGSRC